MKLHPRRSLSLLLLGLGAAASAARAADPLPPPASEGGRVAAEAAWLSADPDHLVRHDLAGDRFYFGGQENVVLQMHPGFRSPYEGEHSLGARRDAAVFSIGTLYFAARPLPYTEIMVAPEMAAGSGLSDAVGMAGFSDVDVVRTPDLGSDPYVGRLVLHQTIPLSDEEVDNPALGPLSTRARVPAHRLELHFGKMSIVDFFDLNAIGSDSHFQFLNWTTVNDGAYDYAADTRGYTYAAVLEYQGPLFAARVGEALMPKLANGVDLDYHLTRAHAENVELEVHGRTFGERSGAARLLGWMNHANMGSYRLSRERFEDGLDARPDITASRRPGRVKVGAGLNVEQEVTASVRAFARLGWNDDREESFAYTEVGDTLQAGLDVRGDLWGRERDKLGLTFTSNGLGVEHRRYLARGGLGFILGDGALAYGREDIAEAYYTVRLGYGVSLGPDIQWIENPGYNRDRGPVVVFSLRFHLEL